MAWTDNVLGSLCLGNVDLSRFTCGWGNQISLGHLCHMFSDVKQLETAENQKGKLLVSPDHLDHQEHPESRVLWLPSAHQWTLHCGYLQSTASPGNHLGRSEFARNHHRDGKCQPYHCYSGSAGWCLLLLLLLSYFCVEGLINFGEPQDYLSSQG